MKNETLSMIAQRRSHREYEATPLTKEQLDALMKAALESPSARNLQPWHFTIVHDQTLLRRVNEAAKAEILKKEDPNPRFEDPAYDIFYHAPTVIFLSAPKENPFAQIDCGIAVQTLALAAESMGLGTVILGLPREAFFGDQKESLEKALQFPKGNSFVIAISIGVPTDTKEAHPIEENKITIID